MAQGRGRDSESSALWRVSGLGFELAMAIAAMAFFGWLLDRWFGTTPTWTVVGAFTGVLGGGYNFVRSALKLNRDASSAWRRSQNGAAEGRSTPPSRKPPAREIEPDPETPDDVEFPEDFDRY